MVSDSHDQKDSLPKAEAQHNTVRPDPHAMADQSRLKARFDDIRMKTGYSGPSRNMKFVRYQFRDPDSINSDGVLVTGRFDFPGANLPSVQLSLDAETTYEYLPAEDRFVFSPAPENSSDLGQQTPADDRQQIFDEQQRIVPGWLRRQRALEEGHRLHREARLWKALAQTNFRESQRWGGSPSPDHSDGSQKFPAPPPYLGIQPGHENYPPFGAPPFGCQTRGNQRATIS